MGKKGKPRQQQQQQAKKEFKPAPKPVEDADPDGYSSSTQTDAESVDFQDAADGLASPEEPQIDEVEIDAASTKEAHEPIKPEEDSTVDAIPGPANPVALASQETLQPSADPAPPLDGTHPADRADESRRSHDSAATASARISASRLSTGNRISTDASAVLSPVTRDSMSSKATSHDESPRKDAFKSDDTVATSASTATVTLTEKEPTKEEEQPLSSSEIRESLSRSNSEFLILDEETAKESIPQSVEKVPPSVGATSMLEPDETISNPFASASGSSSPSSAWADVPRSDADPKRFSSTGESAKARSNRTSFAAAAPDTPSINSNHFSVVSLSSNAPSVANGSASGANAWADGVSKRSTITTTGGDSSPGNGSGQNYDFLLARLENQNAKLHNDPKAMRASVDGVDKLKQNFEKLREQDTRRHSRGDSQNRPLQGSKLTQDGSEDGVHADANGIHQVEVPLGDDLEDEAIDWEFWGTVMSNYQEVARTQPRDLSRAIQAGIPAALRGMMWQLMSSSKDEEMEIIYAYYLKQTSPHEKAIRRDLNRTFPEQDYFQDGKGIGQENLFNVVKAYSLYDPEVGYCQGMQFVVGPLLLNMPDEEAFSTLVRLMKSYDLRGHFTPNMPSLQLRLFQFDRLLEEFLPLLHMHLVRQGVKSSMYASQWFMTLFSYRFPLDLVYRILDSVFAEGVEALFRFALAVMKKNEDALLKLNFDQAVSFLKQSLFDVYLKDAEKKVYRTNEFVRDAFQIKITPFMLDAYAAEFDEQVRAANAHRREVEALRLVNRNLAARVKSLEEQLNSVNAEHVDLVKSVVMAKIAKEEMAEELVKYKMMYAEAVLQADQENSNRGSTGPRTSARSSG